MTFVRPDRLADHFHNVLQAIARIEAYLNDCDEAGFLGSDLLQDAVIRNLEVIGEALHKIEEENPAFHASHGELPWDEAYGMRNLLSHGYFKVQPSTVWRTVKENLPELRLRVQEILEATPRTGELPQPPST